RSSLRHCEDEADLDAGLGGPDLPAEDGRAPAAGGVARAEAREGPRQGQGRLEGQVGEPACLERPERPRQSGQAELERQGQPCRGDLRLSWMGPVPSRTV
ncbi:unnamed protein product, partial [Prorocentrum cordatum]